jgi:hypothetical protein
MIIMPIIVKIIFALMTAAFGVVSILRPDTVAKGSGLGAFQKFGKAVK